MRTPKISLRFAALFLATLLVGCVSKQRTTMYRSIVDFPKDGCRMYHCATTTQPVGQIYTVEKKRGRELLTNVKDLSDRLPIEAHYVHLPTIETRRTNAVHAGALFSLLAQGIPLKAQTSSDMQKTIQVQISLRDVMQEAVQVDALISSLRSLDPKAYQRVISPNAEYYVILEAYKAKHVEVRFTDNSQSQSVLDSLYRDLIAANASVSRGGADRNSLICDFDDYYRVFYYPKQIRLASSFLGGDNLELFDVAEDKLLLTTFEDMPAHAK